MSKQTQWQKAKKRAEAECPYQKLTEGWNELPSEQRDALWDADFNRTEWIPGFAYGALGVPETEIERRDNRFFWQGYEAGFAAAGGAT